ncbi:MAG: GIY-YIG nuclease family protein [Candidatus Korobacteraceae bacterium]|jgi:putative endonuclease
MAPRREHCYTVYLLGSSSGTLYVGITSNLRFRVRQHKEHTFRGFTAEYEVDRLLYFETYGEVLTAIHREKQLKGWRRDKKISLIETVNPQWKDLSRGWYDKPVRATFNGSVQHSGPSTPIRKSGEPPLRMTHLKPAPRTPPLSMTTPSPTRYHRLPCLISPRKAQ